MINSPKLDSMKIDPLVLLDVLESFGVSDNLIENIDSFLLSILRNGIAKNGLISISYKGVCYSTQKRKLSNEKIEEQNKVLLKQKISQKGNYWKLKNNISNKKLFSKFKFDSTLDTYCFTIGEYGFLLLNKGSFNSQAFSDINRLIINFEAYIKLLLENSILRKNAVDLKDRLNFAEAINENFPQNYVLLDLKFKVAFLNQKSKVSVRNFENKEVKIGDDFMGSILPIHKKAMKKALLECKKGDLVRIELEIPSLSEKKNQNFETWSILLSPVFDLKNEIGGYLIQRENISERKKIERESNINVAMLSSIIEHSLDDILMVNDNGDLIFANHNAIDAFKRNFGFNLKQDHQVFGAMPKEYKDMYQPLFEEALRGRSILFDFESTSKIKSEEKRYSKVSFKSVKNDDGGVIAILVVARDVTDMKAKTDSVRQSESMLKSIIESSPENILVFDDKMKVLMANSGSKKGFLKNFEVKISPGIELFKVLPAKQRKKYRNYYRQAINGETIDFNFDSSPDENGEIRNLIITMAPLKTENNVINGVITLTKDVTELVQSAKRLTEREATLDAVLNGTPNGIFAIDKNYKFLSINKQARLDFREQLGVDISEGTNLKDVIAPEVLKRWDKEYFSRVFKNERFTYKGKLNNSLGEAGYVENTYGPLVDSEGKIIGCLEVSRDVTNEVQRKLELELSEAKYKSLVDASPTGISKVDEHGTILFISKRVEEIFGVTQKEMIGKTIFDFIVGQYDDELKEFLLDLGDIGSSRQKSFEIVCFGKNQKRIYLDGIAKINFDDTTEKPTFLMVFNDVTNRVMAEKKLKSTQDFYSTMYENMFDPIFVYDFLKEEIVACNTAASNLLNMSKEELIGKSRFDISPQWSEFYPGVDLYENMHMQQGLKDISSISYSSKGVVKGNSKNDILIEMNVISTERSEGEAFVIMHDQTELFISNKNLFEINSRIEKEIAIYNTLVQNSFDGIDIIEYDVAENGNPINGNLVVRNKNMHNFYQGKDLHFDRLEHFKDFLPELQPNGRKSKEVLWEVIHNTLERKKIRIEFRLQYPNGQIMDLESSQSLIDIEGKIILIKSYRDISDRLKQQKIIEQQIEDLNLKNLELKKYISSNLQLENFAYIASHDLKAPLRTVVSFTHLLKNKSYHDLNPKSQKYLDIVIDSSENMQKLIDDLLTYSRVNTEKMKVKKVDMSKLMSRINLELHAVIDEKNASIKVQEGLPSIYVDESMMIQLFGNLVRNALKFVEEGKRPVVEIGFKELDLFWEFSIKDNGIGIKIENQDIIFNTFEKLHSNDIYEGTGLGLTICKKIIDNHDGRIKVKSQEGKGSKFIFTIAKNIREKNSD